MNARRCRGVVAVNLPVAFKSSDPVIQPQRAFDLMRHGPVDHMCLVSGQPILRIRMWKKRQRDYRAMGYWLASGAR